MKQLIEDEDEYRNRRIEDLEEKLRREGLTEEEQEELKRLHEW